MSPIRALLVIASIATAFFPVSAKAFTTDFFPGDSHFTTGLSQRSLKQIKVEDGLQFDYSPFAGSVMFCGSAGFSKIEIQGDFAKLKANYIHVAEILFKNFSMDITDFGLPSENENNFFPVFIYNRDFDFQNTIIGPRYNEDWREVQLDMFGLDHAIYPGFDRDRDMYYLDIINAKKKSPLRFDSTSPKNPQIFSKDGNSQGYFYSYKDEVFKIADSYPRLR